MGNSEHDIDTAEVAAFIERAVRGIRYGSIELTIHDGRIVQIERREKTRLDNPRSPTPREPS